eukprot:TRINITY_DN111179_c0_g1_i1.p1 TRINITY_DN111179_c0_g1~~TRINITY_DN111179_c0_g1_i1.p1  ORF type:complete len:359 (-),score=77.94 TRINITY_DN111179_c0_g1_i1:184-1260(-)
MQLRSSTSSRSNDNGGRDLKGKVLHQLAKTTLCNFYAAGGCPAGDSCNFAHGTEELQAKPNFCKTSLCRAWQEGKCDKTAAKCPFAHGYSEMRATAAFDPAAEVEDPRKKRAAFWKRVGKKNNGRGSKMPAVAGPSREDALPMSKAAAEHEDEAAVVCGRKFDLTCHTAAAEEQSSLFPDTAASDSVGSWSSPLGSQVRWSDLSDDEGHRRGMMAFPSPSHGSQEPVMAHRAYSGVFPAAAGRGFATSGARQYDVAIHQPSMDRQSCILSIDSMLRQSEGLARSEVSLPPCGAHQLRKSLPGPADVMYPPMQQGVVMLVPVLVPEQYLVQQPGFQTSSQPVLDPIVVSTAGGEMSTQF